MRRVRIWIVTVVLVTIVAALGLLVGRRLLESRRADAGFRPTSFAAPVEVADVQRGPIELRRIFSGAIEASARVTIAPKVAGRVAALPVDLADQVSRGQVVARLDSAEFEQAVAQAEADLAVTRASLAEAESATVITERELERVQTLHDRQIASESQLDTLRANALSKQAAVEVARAQVMRSEAALQTAKIRLGYTTITADWEGGDETRVVAERYVDEGDTLAANTPLLLIIELDPTNAIIYATEREYALLSPGQVVTLTTDAFAGRRWRGEVARISPVFREGTRQARVEVRVPNANGDLKPGMFARVEAILAQEDDATIVPIEALAERNGRTVVFVVNADDSSVRMAPVEVGIQDGNRVQVMGDNIAGRVVTLGQQLIEDNAEVTIPADARIADSPAAAGPQGPDEG